MTENAAPWFLATCLDCQPALPQPFNNAGERDAWAIAHRAATGHAVLVETEADTELRPVSRD